MPIKCLALLATRHIPDPDGRIAAPRCKELSIGGEDHTGYGAAVRFQNVARLPLSRSQSRTVRSSLAEATSRPVSGDCYVKYPCPYVP